MAWAYVGSCCPSTAQAHANNHFTFADRLCDLGIVAKLSRRNSHRRIVQRSKPPAQQNTHERTNSITSRYIRGGGITLPEETRTPTTQWIHPSMPRHRRAPLLMKTRALCPLQVLTVTWLPCFSGTTPVSCLPHGNSVGTRQVLPMLPSSSQLTSSLSTRIT